MIYAYYETDNIDYWLSRSGIEFQRDLDYDTWMTRPHQDRLSLHEELVSSPESMEHIHQLIRDSGLCMIFVPELIDDAWFEQFDKKNVVFFMAGFINLPESAEFMVGSSSWYRAVLKEISRIPDIQITYAKIASPNWPEFQDLLDLEDPPGKLIDEICDRINQHPRINRWIAPGQQDTSIEDRWCRIMQHPLFADFYHNVRDPSWPELDQLRNMKIPPELIRQEIMMSFQDPEEQDPDQHLERVQDVLSVSGQVLGLQWAKSEFHYYFFWSTVDLYHRRPNILELLKPETHQKNFDVLLGRKKRHRDLIYENIDHDKNIVTYFSGGDPDDILCSDNFIWPESVLSKPKNPIKDTTEEIVIDGVIASVSQVIPTEIYNQTRYSLICESQCDNGFSFFTEKIIKPMMARRMFVVLSGQHYLRNLRKLGFLTFDGIIDESYDDLLRMEDRAKAVLETVKYMQDQDSDYLYDQAKDILEHNYRLIMLTDWQQVMCDAIKKHVDNTFVDK